jgi:hypothetical protein
MNRSALFAHFFVAVLLVAPPSASFGPPDPAPLPSAGSGVRGVRANASDVPQRAAATSVAPQTGSPESLAASGIASAPARLAFDGIINETVSIVPPDTHVAVGRGYGTVGRVVMVTNLSAQIWDKRGNPVTSELLIDTMFAANVFDPKILYDQHSERFFIVALEGTSTTPGTSVIHIAVSSDAYPDDLSSDWTFLSGSATTMIGGSNTWVDYPGIGADDAALFVTANMFSFTTPLTYHGVKVRVFDKADLLSGIYGYSDLDYDSSVIAVSTTQPAHVFGSTDNDAFYLISRIDSDFYRLFSISGHPAAPISTTSTFPWVGGSFPADDGADQCDQAMPDVDTLSSRVQSAVYRDDHIWLALTADPDDDGETEVVWQQIATNDYPTADPTVAQAGYIDGTGIDAWTYMPALGINSAGDAAIVYTQSSATECPNMYYATRNPLDAAGSFRDPVLQRLSDGFYDSYRSTDPDRWGDYAAVAIDPSDNCFWLASEFVWNSGVATSDWGTHIANVCTYLPVPAIPTPYLFVLGVSLAAAAMLRAKRATARSE